MKNKIISLPLSLIIRVKTGHGKLKVVWYFRGWHRQYADKHVRLRNWSDYLLIALLKYVDHEITTMI